MIYHLVVGDEAARPLAEAVALEPSMAGEVVLLKDILHVGPLQRGEGQSFTALRSEWWQQVSPETRPPIEVPDLDRLLEVSNELHKSTSAQAWFWMAPGPADVTAYYWVLSYLAKHSGRFHIVSLANLPFLDENGKVFYPRNISELLPKEIVKARRLARAVTPAEIEVDGEIWRSLVNENGGIRTFEGGKKLISRQEDYYDAQLLSLLGGNFQKGSRVLQLAMSKCNLPTGDTHLAWRLRQLAGAGMIELKGDTSKPYRDWEVRLPVGEQAEAAPQ